MLLTDGKNGHANTSNASKKSKISLWFTEVHTSVLVPLMALPLFPFLITVKISAVCILVLILLERRGWTVTLALKRIRSRVAGRVRSIRTRATLRRRSNVN